MNRTRRAARDAVVWVALTGGLVALVLGRPIIGFLLCAWAVWQFALIARGRPTLFVDQRAADRPGKSTLRS